MFIANEATYSNLSTFETIEQVNEAGRHYKDMIRASSLRSDVKRNLLTVFEYLKRHSCHFFGVSWKGKRRIAADLKLSDKTVTRLCARLESLGIIKQYKTKRASNMNQTTNAIVIQPVVDESVRQEAAEVSDHKDNISLKQNTYINKRNASDVQHTYDHSFVSSNIPQDFIDAVRFQYPTANEIYKLWGRLTLAARKSKFPDLFENHMDEWIKTLKESLYNAKYNKVRGDFFGYMYGAWRNAMSRVARQINRDNHYDWLSVQS
jgi:DNA-binding Lrp family transcriptional regulator